MKVLLTISYDGTNYCGWQRQSKGISIQEAIENALQNVVGEEIKIVGSGRTDAGVHAEGQTASFFVDKNIPAEKYAKALNTALPNDIKILKSEKVKEDFDACRKAKKKTYKFCCYVSDIIKPLKDRYAVQIVENPPLDIEKMKDTAKLFLGEHDFKAFCASGSQVKTTNRTIYKCEIKKSGEDLTFTICGNGFLYNMVRIIVGTIIMVGKNKFTIEEVKKMLDTGIRPMSVKTLPARGLCLQKVEYK